MFDCSIKRRYIHVYFFITVAQLLIGHYKEMIAVGRYLMIVRLFMTDVRRARGAKSGEAVSQ